MSDHAVATAQDAEDLVRGLALLGVGGGGLQKVGLSRLLPHVEAGKLIQWVPPDEVPHETWTCVMGGMGSIAPQEPLSAEERHRLGYGDQVEPYPGLRAIQYLGEFSGAQIGALVPFEPGAGSTTILIDAAVRSGRLVVDGDYCGRAVPEAAQALPAIYGASHVPAVLCDPWGNAVVIKSSPSPQVTERLGKMISIVTHIPDPLAPTAMAIFLMPGREMKEFLIAGTLTRCLRLGRAIREARTQGEDPAAAAADFVQGWVLFRGVLTSKEWENRDGYMFGTTVIEGSGPFQGRAFKIWFQNENHITWLDGEPYVTSPDLISVISEESGDPFTNTLLDVGHRVAVLGVGAHPRYRTEIGLEALGPRHFGFGLDYRPIEELV